MRNIPGLLLLAGLVALSVGCRSQAPVANKTDAAGPFKFINFDLAGQPVEVISFDDAIALYPEQQAAFAEYMASDQADTLAPHKRTADYIEEIVQHFEYRDQTVAPALALQQGGGNCMSLAMLTTSLANQAGVEVRYRLIEQMPVFSMSGSIGLTSVHVRTILIENQQRTNQNGFSFSSSRVAIDFFPSASDRRGRAISHQEFESLYYRNLAVESLIDSDLDLAFQYAVQSLAAAPDNPESINLMATLHQRLGDDDTAERLFQHGIAHAPETLNLLDNYQYLLARQGRMRERKKLIEQIHRLDHSSPFGWYRLALSAAQQENNELAIRYYKRALEYAPDLKVAWLGLANAYTELGSAYRANEALQQALDIAQSDQQRTAQLDLKCLKQTAKHCH